MHEHRRVILSFYCNSGLREVIPIYPLYAIMFGEHGVTPFQLALLFVIWAAVGLVLEVPSGAVADRYSRKWLVVASGLLKSAAFLSWYLWQDFYGYALGFLLWGTGSSLRSGAWEALLFDLLKEWRQEGHYARVFGRSRALALLGVGLGEFLGGALIVNGYDLVLMVSMAVPLLATLPFILWVPDAAESVTSAAMAAQTRATPMVLLRRGVRVAISSRTVLYILLVSSLLICAWGVYDEFVTPTLREKGFPLQLVAYLGATIYFSEAAGMVIAGHLRQRPMEELLLFIGCAGLLLQGAVHAEGWPVIAFLCLFAFLFGLAGTQYGAHLQHAIDSDTRATVTSMVGFGEGVGAIVGFLLFGWVAEYHGMVGGTFATSLAVILLAATFYWLHRRWFADS